MVGRDPYPSPSRPHSLNPHPVSGIDLESSHDLFTGPARPCLKVLHGVQSSLVRSYTRTTDAVLHDSTEIVMLMSIDERIMHADIGQGANKDQRVPVESLQQYLQIGTKEA